MRKLTATAILFSAVLCLTLSACGTKGNSSETELSSAVSEEVSEILPENSAGTEAPVETDGADTDDTAEMPVPAKEEVLAMRETVLEGMSDEDAERLTENIKVANLRLESAYLYDDIFGKLSDKDSLYWNYFDQKGDIQIGWMYDGERSEIKTIMESEGLTQNEFYEKYGEPVTAYNRFDADNFIALIQDMQASVQDEMLRADLQQLIDLTALAKETHEMTYANQIYKILHDLDYFLLRYGIEDVGPYTRDGSVVAKYYGVLAVYGAAPFEAGAELSQL